MTCPKCGADAVDGSCCCPRCGASVAPVGEQNTTDARFQHEESPLTPPSPIDRAPASPSNDPPSGGPRYTGTVTRATKPSPMHPSMSRDAPATLVLLSSPKNVSHSGGPRHAGTVTRAATVLPIQPSMPGAGENTYGASRGGGPGQVTPSSRRLAPYATWWSRVGSRIIDGLILFVPRLILVYVVLLNFDSSLRGGRGLFFTQAGDFFHSVEIAFPIVGALGILYFVLFNGLGTGQTLGNRAAGIAVRDATTGEAIGIARSFARSLVRTLLYAALLIPAVVKVPIPSLILWIPGLTNDLFPLWDSRRQTLADKVARSVMIKVA
jgi:uncharacterized RDD family membrane protein YckC